MRDFSGPGAPPARYLQRPKGGERSVYKMTRSPHWKKHQFSAYFCHHPPTFLPRFFPLSILNEAKHRCSLEEICFSFGPRSYLDDLFHLYIFLNRFFFSFFFFFRFLFTILNKLKLIECLFMRALRGTTRKFRVNVAVNVLLNFSSFQKI